MTELTPARILQVGTGFWPAKVLLSAVELGLFTALGSGSMTGAQLQTSLGLHPRANPDFFDALVALRFLDRDGDGPAAVYRNTAEAAVIENLIDDARRENAFGLMMSLNMLIEFGDAFDFTGADFTRWCLEAGFRRTEIIPLGGPASAGIAYK